MFLKSSFSGGDIKFSHDNNVVTTLFSHHCCNNLLTSWNRHGNNSGHDCSIMNTNFSCSKKHNLDNIVASSLLNNIVETRMNNVVGWLV